MATTFIDYTGDGNATKSFSFPSIQESDVKVEVDGVIKTSGNHYNITSYTTTGGGNVVFTSGNIPSSPASIRIFRDTDVDSAKATYTAGSSIKAADLNANHEQLLFAAQEEQNQTVITSDIKDAAVTSAKIKDGTIVNADVNASAAIDGSKVNPAFGSQNITTSGTVDGRDVSVDGAKLDGIEAGATADQTAAEIRTLVENASDSNVFTDADHSKLNAIEAGATADQTASEIKTLIASSPLDASHLAANSVTTSEIADAELTTLAGMQSATASKLADSTALTADIADLNQIDGMQKATTITDDDTKFPTSGAVVDYVAAQLEPFGGFEAIANEVSFPNTQPPAGVAISIADAAGIVVNSSGTSTTGRTVGGTTVTINNINSQYNSSTVASGIRFIVTSTGSGQVYNYHKSTLPESDLVNLSGDINDFNERYRVGGSNPTTSLDAGDLFYNTGTNQLLVYNASNAAWEETQSVGNFFINTISSSSATGGGSATPNGTAYRFTLSNAGANAEQHLVSVDGVIQKPNSGTSQPSEGFAVDGADIILGAAPVSGASFFVVTIGASVGIGTPSNNTVTSAILQNGSVTTAKIADANVTTAKIADGNVTAAKLASGAADLLADTSPQLGGNLDGNGFEIALDSDKAITFDGKGNIEYKSGQFQITNSTGDILIDNNYVGGDVKIYTDTDFEVFVNNGEEAIVAKQNGAVELYHDDVKKLETTSAGITVTGQVTSNTLTLSANSPRITFTDLNDNPDFEIHGNSGALTFFDSTNSANRLIIQNDGTVDVQGNLDANGGLDVTGNITCTGTIPAAQLTGTLPAIDGSNLTGLSAGVTSDGQENTVAGTNAGNSFSGTDATKNTLIGYNAGTAITTGDENTAVGSQALETNQTGLRNTAVGYQALEVNLANDNTAIGRQTLLLNTTGGKNTAVGKSALTSNQDASNNVAVGYNSALANTTGTNNTAIGSDTFRYNTTGSNNVALGYRALYNNTTASQNTAVGKDALKANQTGYSHCAFGHGALDTVNGGYACNAFGVDTLRSVTTGVNNCAYGFNAGASITTGNHNLTFGTQAGDAITTTNGNTMFGTYAGSSYQGHNMTAIGYGAAFTATTPEQITAVGDNALYSIGSGGSYSVAFGTNALYSLNSSSGGSCTAVGRYANMLLTTGNSTTSIGQGAGYHSTTGVGNLNLDGAPSTATASYQITLGNTGHSNFRCNDTSISSLSDRRDKTDIVDLPIGLDFVDTLKPRKFKWQTRDGNIKDGSIRAGFIAQELDEAQTGNRWLQLVMDDNPDRLEANEGHLIPVLVKAIQELSAKVKALEAA